MGGILYLFHGRHDGLFAMPRDSLDQVDGALYIIITMR